MTFQTRFFSPHRSGRMLLAVVKGMEDYFPWLCGRFGQYPMFVISKSGSFRMSPESPRLPRG